MTYDEVVTTLRAAGCVWAEEEASLLTESTTSSLDLEAMVTRRAQGVPLELVVGWARFRGLRIRVEPGVFVPRLRTELLAGQAISAVRQLDQPVVVELCCGAGAISAAILAETTATLHAADIDPVAVRVAATNLGTRATLHTGDLFAPLPQQLRGRIDVLVANVPYVPTGDIPFLPAESRLHEPGATVDGGGDGLALFRRLVMGATSWLAPGGRVMSEVSERQAPLAEAIVAGQGLETELHEDPDLNATVVTGVFYSGTNAPN
ncbi:putative protein N(5)-glutamine methyltransferase [Kineosporia sp. NBRC 101731]|uniref:putative protein N(5)-glutamine methyltransferase n=1 Tax=Kineosporia sp. NBRC 101731 TaxID=3032199 RepID=UPI0024A0D79A|nr:putative protein N(5)-glutamine methyltransferase [Kineosporia sp. NBRC 101731]GLY27371.1 methylase [Kineosporia sp. NBRC 101731]